MANEPDHPGVIAPPPLIFLASLFAGLGADDFLGGPGFPVAAESRWIAGGLLILAAAYLIVSALGGFRAAGTAARPWKPTTAIVASGVYRLTRNPMYLGMALAFAGAAFLADSIIAMTALVPALVVIEFGVIRREERYLEAKFGEDYRRYKAAVRRWI